MFSTTYKILFAFALLIAVANTTAAQPYTSKGQTITCGAEKLAELLPLLKDKKVALLVNQTSIVGQTHLIDTLKARGADIKKIFAPEHGFRGTADAGEHVNDTVDKKTGLPVVSLYGEHKKPTAADLKNVDVVIFDIQDVGARFYTYISTLHYIMEACAQNKKELIVLDRPNPNGWYVDGPVLEKGFQSFVGVDPLPVVHGLTIGEYAEMVNGEKWLPDSAQCKLKVIKMSNYTHSMKFSLPVKPSPNLPDSLAIALYPSLCFFEGTNISVGRGTPYPFQVFGSPDMTNTTFAFTPQSLPGAKSPPFLGKKCLGFDLRKAVNVRGNGKLTFDYLILAHALYKDAGSFFLKNNFFDKLAGNDTLRKMIEDGKTDADIRASYAKDLEVYKKKRKKYLLYPDFE